MKFPFPKDDSAGELTREQRDRQTALTVGILVVGSVAIFLLGALLLSKALVGHVLTVADYKLYELQSGEYSTTVDAPGSVQPAKTPVFLPDLDGTVGEVKVKDGDTVKEGQLLVTLQSDAIESELASARADYESAESAESQARASYEAASAELASAQAAKAAALAAAGAVEEGQGGAEDAVQDGGGAAVSVDTSELDAAIQTAQGKVDAASGELDAAQGEVDSASGRYRQAQAQEERLSIKAEASGTVTDIRIQAGMGVHDLVGQGAVLQIADPKGLVVVCSVPEAELSALSRGQGAVVTGIVPDGGTVEALVSRISSTPNQNAASDGGACFDVTLSLNSQDGAQTGMNVSAQIQLQDYGMVFYVPEGAVREEEDAAYIEMVYDDNTSAEHEVQVIATLDDGQKVIRGNALSNGMRIRSDLAA